MKRNLWGCLVLTLLGGLLWMKQAESFGAMAASAEKNAFTPDTI